MNRTPTPRTQKQIVQAFRAQRRTAQQRGIAWHFFFIDWITFWGEDIHRRGQSYAEGRYLVMCRYDDTGPYSKENCYIAPTWENCVAPRSKP
jgi:hypothetical protein